MTYDGQRRHDPGAPAPRRGRRGTVVAIVALGVAGLIYFFPVEAGSLLGADGSDEDITAWVHRIAVGIAVFGLAVALISALVGVRNSSASSTPRTGDW